MMFRYFILAAIVGLIVWSACSETKSTTNAQRVKIYYIRTIDSAETSLALLKQAVTEGRPEKEIHTRFLKARLAYKKTEFLTEYYSPLTARSLNGPPIPEIDVDDQHRITMPEGYQVIEGFIFPSYNPSRKDELLKELKKTGSNFVRLKDLTTNLLLSDQHVFDALRLEIFRVVSLGVSGFDAPASQNSITEAANALTAVSVVLNIYGDSLGGAENPLLKRCFAFATAAERYLSAHPNFNEFNRLAFITEYANPLSMSIFKLAEANGIKAFDESRPLRTRAASMFDANAFDPDYYTYSSELHSSKEKLELGKLLFFDPVLSEGGKRSCATCHNPQKAFTDGLAKNKSISGKSTVFRNTPTVLNAGLQPSLFYDLRVAYLEDQAAEVINNKEEMHGNLGQAAAFLLKSAHYSKLFKDAFPGSSSAISELNIKNAIACYVRSLTSLNSPFDRYVRGDKTQLSANEIKGFNLFMGKAKCGTCHFTPLFNGSVPPSFTKIETEVIGVPVSTSKHVIDTDPGKFNLRHLEMHRNSFKTPSVRNIALTAPYMHNGVFKSLEEVLDFYNKGGGVGLGIPLDNQTLPFDKLNLSKKEQKDIISFLAKLTDTGAAQNVPSELPALSQNGPPRKIPMY